MSLLERLNNALTRQWPVKRAPSKLDRPVASFTFDDFPKSAWTEGGALLERYGARGTYYTAGGACGTTDSGLRYYDAEDLQALHAGGHEVGCHTFSHQRSFQVSSPDLHADFDRNTAFVRELLGEVTLESFAFPYGAVSPRTKRLAGARFPSSRGIRAGVNAGQIELAQLKAVPLEARDWSARQVEGLVESARRQNGWIVFFTHDISDDPSPYGATPAMLEHALESVQAAGIEILPVREARAIAV
jgi:peptidoglycan/xylan/chitin deacetylase (PgdA/CDA1 family)